MITLFNIADDQDAPEAGEYSTTGTPEGKKGKK